ncbi:hypothetical protein N665_1070s0005 [Sinapis alba]|nr:hypothetical protein N665_1070s0005 [Sinapis alba]
MCTTLMLTGFEQFGQKVICFCQWAGQVPYFQLLLFSLFSFFLMYFKHYYNVMNIIEVNLQDLTNN